MIFLNLFLAILLENFEVDEDEDEDGSFIDTALQYLQDFGMNLLEALIDKSKGILRKKENLSDTETNPLNASRTIRVE